MEKFCFLDDTIKTRTGVFDSAVARRNGEVTFRDYLPLLTSRDFPLGAISRSYSTCVCNVMLYGSDTWLVKEDSVIKLEWNYAKMVSSISNIRPEYRNPAGEFKKSQPLRLVWVG